MIFYTLGVLFFCSATEEDDLFKYMPFLHRDLISNIFSVSSLMHCINNPANSFQEVVRMAGRWRRINRSIKKLLDKSKHKKQIWYALIEKFGDHESYNQFEPKAYNLLKDLDTTEDANDMLFDLSKGKDPLCEQYGKRNSADLLFMNMFIIKALQKKGASIHKLNVIIVPDMNPLLFAAFEASQEFVEALLMHGVNPNQSHAQSRKTPLMVARMMGRNDIFELLLRYGADINAVDDSGRTVFADQYELSRRSISKTTVKSIIQKVRPEIKLKRSLITRLKDNF